MRILIVHNILWSHYKSVLFSALHRLSQKLPGCSVDVVQIARNEKSRATLPSAAPDSGSETADYPYTLLFDQYLEDVGVAARTKALINHFRNHRPDILYLTGYYDPAQIALLLLAKAQGVRVVIQNESTPVDQVRNGLKEWLKSRIIRMADGFICFGAPSVQYMRNLGARPEQILVDKSAVVDNDTLLSAYRRALPERETIRVRLGLRPRNFIFVGRLVLVKNLPFLLSAFKEALSRSNNSGQWGLILLGGGELQDQLEQQIRRDNLTEAVRMLPGQPWFRVPEFLALAEVLVLPSVSETWGLVVNEAMVCGMPVLVSSQCGCSHDLVRQGQNGYVFDPYQPEELVGRLLSFMDDSADPEAMGRVSAELIAPFNPNAVAREILDAFGKLIQR